LTELLIAERTKLSWQESIPPALRAFLEEFSGSGGLSRSMRKQGVPCARPREAFPSRGCSGCATRYVSINDLNDDDTCLYLEEEILNGIYCYIHFGIPCKHWGHMNTINGGTRTWAKPEGSEQPLERELLANRQAQNVARLCHALQSVGCLFSIENPLASYLWRYQYIVELIELCGDELHVVDFHQCAFGLQLPGCEEHEYCRKATRIICNFPELCILRRHCPGVSASHKHVHAIGHVVVDGVRVSLCEAAGCYPSGLTEPWSRAAAAAISTRFWNGTRPWAGC